jgi:ParB family chromosome partitioning protein
LEKPKYTIEQIGAKVGKAPAYVASRARLTELIPAVIEAFYAEEIGVGQSSFSSPMHALSAGD